MGANIQMTKILMALLFTFTITLHAEEGGEGGEKKEGGEGAAEKVETPDQKATKELADVEKKVASLSAKIKAKNESIEKLLEERAVEKDASRLAEISQLLKKEHKDLEEATQDYNTQLGVLQYRFPERGVTQGRRYQRLSTKSLEEMEKSMGLDADLKKSRDKVKTVYGVKDDSKTKKQEAAKKNPNADETLLQPSTISK
jgi:hypothetical protein